MDKRSLPRRLRRRPVLPFLRREVGAIWMVEHDGAHAGLRLHHHAPIERQILGVLFDARPGLAEMLGDPRDVELTDGRLLLRRLARQSSGAVRSASSSASAGGVLRKTEGTAGTAGTAGALVPGKPRDVLQCVT